MDPHWIAKWWHFNCFQVAAVDDQEAGSGSENDSEEEEGWDMSVDEMAKDASGNTIEGARKKPPTASVTETSSKARKKAGAKKTAKQPTNKASATPLEEGEEVSVVLYS